MIQTNLVYLDVSFITEAYESIKQTQVPVTVTKTTDMSGGVSAGFFNVGASSQEAKEFPFSSRHMFKEIKTDLDDLPTIDILTTDKNDLPDLFWVDGVFSIGSTQTITKSEVIHRDKYYRFFPETDPQKGFCILAKETYFSAGYEQVLEHIYGASRGFKIPARALLKTLVIQEFGHWPLCAALIITKNENR